MSHSDGLIHEITFIAQKAGEPARRWFQSDFFDLVVWYDESKSRITGFQLSYDKYNNERVLTYREERGYTHRGIDDGEKQSGTKESPILVADGVFDTPSVLNRFRTECSSIDQSVVEYVTTKVTEYDPTL